MELDRFKNHDKEIRTAVLRYEKISRSGTMQYIDIDEMEVVIDFYLEENDLESVEHAIVYAENLFPNSNEIKLRRAHMYSIQGNQHAAMSLLKKIAEVEPDNTDVKYAMGLVYGMLGQSQKAIQYYQLASVDGCELGLLYGNIADEYYKLGQNEKAILYYKKSISINPEEERSMYNLLCVYEDNDLNDEAIEYFKRQTEEHPYSLCAWIAYGRSCANLCLWEKAIDAFEYALVIDKSMSQTYYCLCDAYRHSGNTAKAVEILHESLDYAEDRSWVYYSIGMLYMESGNLSSAIVYFRNTVHEDPYFGDAWQVLGICYAEEGDIYTAIDMTERAISVNPQSALYMKQVANLYDRIDETDKADSLYQYALHLNETSDECWIEYSDFLMHHNRFDEAINILEKGVVAAMYQHPFNLRLAMCHYKIGNRNYLFNALRACLADPEFNEQELFSMCPEMEDDYEVVSIINSK